jgi:hypothetical protein
MVTAILPKADLKRKPLSDHFANQLPGFIEELEIEWRTAKHAPVDAPHRSLLRAVHHVLAGLLELQHAYKGTRS